MNTLSMLDSTCIGLVNMERLKAYKTSKLILLFYFSFKSLEFKLHPGIIDKVSKESKKIFLND